MFKLEENSADPHDYRNCVAFLARQEGCSARGGTCSGIEHHELDRAATSRIRQPTSIGEATGGRGGHSLRSGAFAGHIAGEHETVESVQTVQNVAAYRYAGYPAKGDAWRDFGREHHDEEGVLLCWRALPSQHLIQLMLRSVSTWKFAERTCDRTS